MTTVKTADLTGPWIADSGYVGPMDFPTLVKVNREMLALPSEIVAHFERTGGPTLGDMAVRARAAISRVTGE